MSGYKHRQQVRIGFLMSPELLKRLEGYAAKNELPITDVCRQALVLFLDCAG